MYKKALGVLKEFRRDPWQIVAVPLAVFVILVMGLIAMWLVLPRIFPSAEPAVGRFVYVLPEQTAEQTKIVKTEQPQTKPTPSHKLSAKLVSSCLSDDYLEIHVTGLTPGGEYDINYTMAPDISVAHGGPGLIADAHGKDTVILPCLMMDGVVKIDFFDRVSEQYFFLPIKG